MQELIQKPNNAQVSSLVQLAVARMTETADTQLQDELLSGFEQVLAEIGASATSPIERLLAQEIAVTWTELNKLRATHARLENLRPVQAAWWVQAISAAQLRFFRSVEELSRVRRLAIPIDSGR